MNQNVSIFKLQIEKWTSVIHRGLLSVGETKCLHLLYSKEILVFFCLTE